ncbi:hypothetical protein K1719_041040 [Acacia pycnantha]|nr:hypothetical protein K1719_041040 [Acacia pycnantha]
MALFSNTDSFLFFIILLLLSLQIHARDSQFFSKVTHPINNKKNDKETNLMPNKKEELVTMHKSDQQDQPIFIPEIDNNYGLYGHESATGQFLPATTTTYRPYKAATEEYMSKYPNNKYSYYNRDQNENNSYYKDAYGNYLDNTRYIEGGYENLSNNRMRRKNQKMYNSNNGGYVRYDYNGERQGMSDTRFMGGDGKYYYENSNSMEGYQNQLGFGGNNNMDGFHP